MKRRPAKVTDKRTARSAHEHVFPVVAEEIVVGRKVVEAGRVRIHKTVEEQTRRVDEPLMHEEVVVRRVAVNRPVDSPPPVRQEGDITIIPVVQEELVIEKRLVLVEEVHVQRKSRVRHEPKDVVVRRERAEVERIGARHGGETPAKDAEK